MSRSHTITIKQVVVKAGLSLSLLLVPASLLLAHGGFDHVIGTIVQADNHVLMVKTAKGNVDVKLDEKTEITKGDQKAGVADLKPGARVVVDIPEGSKEKIAHSVKVGTAGSAPAHDHHSEK